MNISANQGSGTAKEINGPIGPVLNVNEYKLEACVLRPLAHSLGLSPAFCQRIPHNFERHVFDQLCAPLGTWSPFNDIVADRREESSRIALRALLEEDYQHGRRTQVIAVSPQLLSLDRHAILSTITPRFAHGTTPNELMNLLQGSDLSRVVLPVIDSFINDTDGYLTRRIPPHIGHGVRKTIVFEKPEVIQAEKESEAQQDRGSASALLRHFKNFLTSGSTENFTLLMRKFNNCGEWLWWLTETPTEAASHPEAEQVLANTIVRLLKLKEFGKAYEDEYMTPGACGPYVRWHWFEPCPSTHRIDPLAYPLVASALELLARDDFKHL